MSRLKTTLAFALSALALAACGGDEETTTETSSQDGQDGGGGTALEVTAVPDGGLAFEQDSLEAKAGQVTATFDNPAPIAHDFCVEGPDGNELGCTDLIADGDTDVAQFDLESGEYTYFCSVAGHREGGMEGTLTVE